MYVRNCGLFPFKFVVGTVKTLRDLSFVDLTVVDPAIAIFSFTEKTLAKNISNELLVALANGSHWQDPWVRQCQMTFFGRCPADRSSARCPAGESYDAAFDS